MEDVKSLKDMNIDELALLLMREPDRVREVCEVIDDVTELYNAIVSYRLPDDALFDDSDVYNNQEVQQALESLSDYLGYDIEKGDPSYDDYIYDAPEHEYAQSLKDEISYGATPAELRTMCEDRGYVLEEIFDTTTLLELYESFGYTYDPESDSITQIERKPENKEILDWLEGRENTPTANSEKVYTVFGGQFTEKQIIEGINEDSFYYWDIIDIIRENETIRDMVLRKITSLDVTSEEYADYRKLLDEIHHIRANELQNREAELSSLEAEEKTISEAEALIDKQNAKQGQNIGE